MTNKPMLSVERELIQRIADHCKFWVDHPYLEAIADVGVELRALLDNPSECRCKRYGKDNPHWPCPVHAEPAAQRQGEPAVLMELVENKIYGGMHIAKWDNPGGLKEGFHKLYAEQPEPVADQAQCEECKGWGYHENHHEGGGTECGECGGSGNATVAVVIPDHTMRSVMDAIQQARGFPVTTSNQCHALAESLNYVARLNGVKP